MLMDIFFTKNPVIGKLWGLSNDVQEYVEACRECARVKPWSKPARVPMKPILLAAAPNHRIHFFFGRGLTSGDERACPKEAKASH